MKNERIKIANQETANQPSYEPIKSIFQYLYFYVHKYICTFCLGMWPRVSTNDNQKIVQNTSTTKTMRTR